MAMAMVVALVLVLKRSRVLRHTWYSSLISSTATRAKGSSAAQGAVGVSTGGSKAEGSSTDHLRPRTGMGQPGI